YSPGFTGGLASLRAGTSGCVVLVRINCLCKKVSTWMRGSLAGLFRRDSSKNLYSTVNTECAFFLGYRFDAPDGITCVTKLAPNCCSRVSKRRAGQIQSLEKRKPRIGKPFVLDRSLAFSSSSGEMLRAA